MTYRVLTTLLRPFMQFSVALFQQRLLHTCSCRNPILSLYGNYQIHSYFERDTPSSLSHLPYLGHVADGTLMAGHTHSGVTGNVPALSDTLPHPS